MWVLFAKRLIFYLYERLRAFAQMVAEWRQTVDVDLHQKQNVPPIWTVLLARSVDEEVAWTRVESTLVDKMRSANQSITQRTAHALRDTTETRKSNVT